MNITIDPTDILHLISRYLTHTGHHQSAYCLELESSTCSVSYGRDITFARDLCMAGNYPDLIKFCEPLKRSAFDYNRSVFLIEKQKFLEMLNSQTTSTCSSFGHSLGHSKGHSFGHHAPPATSETLVAQLKTLENKCTQEEFHGLCFCLTVNNLQSHPDYKTWSVYQGRAALFNDLLSKLECCFPDQVVRKGRTANMPDDQLLTISKQAILHQMAEFNNANPNATVPNDFIVSVLGDVLTYKKRPTGNGNNPDNSATLAPTHRNRRNEMLARSMPSHHNNNGVNWVIDDIDDSNNNNPRTTTAATAAATATAANNNNNSNNEQHPVNTAVTETQGFYGLEPPPANSRFDPPLEQTFPPVVIKPPVKWEINLDDDEDEVDETELPKETTPELEEERRAREAAELAEEEEANNATKFPPINPDDPYSHPECIDNFMLYKPLSTLQESHPIRTVSWSSSGNAFCVGTNSQALRICQLDENQGISVLHERSKHHNGSVYCCDWNADDRLVATGSNDKTVKVVKVFLDDADGLGVVSNSLEQDDLVLKGHTGTVRDVSFHSEDPGRLLSCGAGDNCCNVWDIVGGSAAAMNMVPVRKLAGHEGTVYTGRFSPFDSNSLATGSADNTVKLWDLRSMSNEKVLSMSVGSPILSLLWGSKHTLVTSHADGSIRELDIRTGKESSVIQAHQDECRSLDATPCGRFVVTGSFDGLASIFSLTDSAPDFIASLRIRSGGRILSAKWRPRGDQGVLVAGADCSVTYWGKYD
jgi:hypothetical protein